MKNSALIPVLTLAAAPFVFAAPAATPQTNICFVGDSITNGGKYLAGPVPSYRYQVFKNYVDNNIAFFPMGMTRGAAFGFNVSALTPAYRGYDFPNVSEAAASGRAYQYAGHGNGKMSSGNNYKGDPGTAVPKENRGPVTLKLGFPNTFVKDKKQQKTSFYDGVELKKYAGETYKSLYKNKKVDTLCILIGINDLYDAWEPNEKIIEHVKNIVLAYQKHNPAVRVHVFELLPTARNNGTGTNNKNNYNPYNADLRREVKKWSKGKSIVSCERISQGFYAEDGSHVDTDRGAHPTAQGELIVAGNIARALGVGQRTAGLKRVPAEKLEKPEFKIVGDGVKKSGSEFKVDSPLKGGSDLRYDWPQSGEKHECTLEFTVKMQNKRSGSNFVSAILGNGEEVGLLYIGEKGVYWNETQTLLYGTKDMENGEPYFSREPVAVRMAYLKKADKGVKPGYYIWINGQMIGEGLSGQNSGPILTHADRVLIGDGGGATETQAVIGSPAVDAKSAFAPGTSAE